MRNKNKLDKKIFFIVISVLAFFSGAILILQLWDFPTANTQSEDISLCYKMKNIDMRSNCLTKIASAHKDISICDQITQQPTIKDYCYLDIGSTFQDSYICSQIKGVKVRDKCYSSVAIQKNDPSICTNMLGDRSLCYEEISFQTKDMSVCNRIPDELEKSWCYEGLISVQKDISICDQISDEYWLINVTLFGPKAMCYLELARATQDPSICDKIENQEIKSNCLDSYDEIPQDY